MDVPLELTLATYAILFVGALFAGLVDAVAGGGGLISLPLLLNVGFPVPAALATNKLQSSFGSVTASVHYAKSGAVDVSKCTLGLFCSVAGSIAGAWAVQRMDGSVLAKLIPWLLAAILIYLLLKPELGQRARKQLWPTPLFFTVFGLGLGFYDGFFGPGTGSFWTMALVLLLGMEFVVASGHARAMNAASNVGSLVFFVVKGHVVWPAGLLMAAGQVVGARIGARLAIQRGSRFVRPVFLVIVLLTLARLIYVTYLR